LGLIIKGSAKASKESKTWNGLFFSEKLLQFSIHERDNKGDMKDTCKVRTVPNWLYNVFLYTRPSTASETGRFKILHIHESGNSHYILWMLKTSVQGETQEVQGRDVHW